MTEAETKVDDLAIADLSPLPKAGLKGPNAHLWLAERGIAVPGRPNTWTALKEGGLIARLAETEFFIEDGPAGGVARRVNETLGAGAPKVYPVLHQDLSVALAGHRIHEVLLQVCSVDFAAMRAPGLALTSMAGVSVLALPATVAEVPLVRIWADPSFGPYLWRTLLGIVRELGGGPLEYGSFLSRLKSQGGFP
jgi:sarcosine oxidase subunit gamma